MPIVGVGGTKSGRHLTDVVRIIAWHDPTVEAMPNAISTASDLALVWTTSTLGDYVQDLHTEVLTYRSGPPKGA